jgi:hypothetical protein
VLAPILTAIPDGKAWVVKIVTPKGESVRSFRVFRTRREALDHAVLISKETGWAVLP